MKNTTLLFLIAVLPFANTARAFQVDFSRDVPGELFDESTGGMPEVTDGLAALPARIDTRSLPVEALKKYKLRIDAEVTDDFVVEENDRAHILTRQSHLNRLSSGFSVIFQNAEGEEIPGFGGDTARGFFLTKKQHPYVAVFYAPAGAKNLRVRFQSNHRSTQIAGLQLVEETEEGTINPNPDFRYGELNYSGWKPQRDGRLYTRPDGKTVLNWGYRGDSPFFPLSPMRKYAVSATGEGGNLNIQYYDKDGKQIISRFLLRAPRWKAQRRS